jgi:hypothetical protein
VDLRFIADLFFPDIQAKENQKHLYGNDTLLDKICQVMFCKIIKSNKKYEKEETDTGAPRTTATSPLNLYLA